MSRCLSSAQQRVAHITPSSLTRQPRRLRSSSEYTHWLRHRIAICARRVSASAALSRERKKSMRCFNASEEESCSVQHTHRRGKELGASPGCRLHSDTSGGPGLAGWGTPSTFRAPLAAFELAPRCSDATYPFPSSTKQESTPQGGDPVAANRVGDAHLHERGARRPQSSAINFRAPTQVCLL